MTISEIEMNELLVSVSSKCERSIASAIFNLENVLREIIALIAANPQKLQDIGGPIRSVERVTLLESVDADQESPHIFNVKLSVDSIGESVVANEISLRDTEQQLDVNGQKISLVNSEQQLDVNGQKISLVNSEQPLDINGQEISLVNSEQQLDINEQEISLVNSEQQLDINEQEISLVNSEQQLTSESIRSECAVDDECTNQQIAEELIVDPQISEISIPGEHDIGTSIDQDVEVTTFTTTEQDGVRVHIQSVETKAKSMATSKLSDSNNLHACPMCERTFLRVFELQRHITVRHTDEKKFVCEQCGQRFALKLYLNNHMRSRHLPNREKPFACPHCDYRCILQSLLTRHMAKHIKDKTYQCLVCQKHFYAQKHLDRHMYRHKEKNLSCESCDYKTADPYKLRTHLKVHTSTEEFSCSQCEYKTNLKSELSKHNLNEHPDVEYKCHQCDLVFKRPGNLKRHLYVHQEKNLHCPHKNCQWKTADPYELKRHEQEHVNGKKHVCETCGYAFYRAFDLKKHKKTHLKVHLCRDCNTVFADSHALACHKRRRHPKVRSLVPTPADTLSEVSALAAPSREVDSGDREKGESEPLPMGEKYDNSQIVVIPEESSCQPLVLSGGDDGHPVVLSDGAHTHSIVIDHSGQAVIVDGQHGDYNGFITVMPESDQQLLEMASVIVAQAGQQTEQVVCSSSN